MRTLIVALLITMLAVRAQAVPEQVLPGSLGVGAPPCASINVSPCFLPNSAAYPLYIITSGNAPLPTGAFTDHSGSITLGGTAQNVFALDATRVACFVQNISNADEWLSITGTASAAAGSADLPPLAVWSFPLGGCPTGAISIYGASTAQAFTAWSR